MVVARDARRFFFLAAHERAHAGIGMDHLRWRYWLLEVLRGQSAQVRSFISIDGYLCRIAAVVHIGGADEREVLLVRNGKDDATVAVLEDVGVVVVEKLRHNDVTALHQANRGTGLGVERLLHETLCPWARSVHHGAGVHRAFGAVGGQQGGLPARSQGANGGSTLRRSGTVSRPLQLRTPRARQHGGAMGGRIDGIQHHQSRVIHPHIGINEARLELRLQWFAGCVLPQFHRTRTGQALASCQVVVKEQTNANHPCRTQVRFVRHDKPQRPENVRRRRQQHFAFSKRLSYQAELVVLQVAQATMDELGAGRRRMRRQVVLFAQHHLQPTTGSITRDTGTVDAATDYQQVAIHGLVQRCHSLHW